MSILTIHNYNLDIQFEESYITYSNNNSRPSKSLIIPEMYTIYKSIKEPLIVSDSLFLECINYVFTSIIKINENVYLLDNESYKILNFTEKKFKIITESLNDKYVNYIIITNDLFTYPKIQYFYILINYFESVDIIMSQIMPYILVVYKKRRKNLNIEIKNNYVKDFNVKVDENILKCIKTDNTTFLQNYINVNKKISNMCSSILDISNLNREIYTINKYYKAFTNKECNIDCNCKPNFIFYSDILNCHICENCLVLTRLPLIF
jgi:hypothetical protein